jgi:hypothetical protein
VPRQGMAGFVWLGIGVIALLLGLIVWLFVRPEG